MTKVVVVGAGVGGIAMAIFMFPMEISGAGGPTLRDA
jgi:cation diffusion facilitator CzcD-associated flavoprotein CzcO